MTYTTQIFKSSHSYTTHPKASVDFLEAIRASNFDNIPKSTEAQGTQIELYDDAERFLPPDSDDWIKHGDEYRHKSTGVMVRLEECTSPDYYKPNESSTLQKREITLTIKTPIE